MVYSNFLRLAYVIERAVITSRAGSFHCELPSKDAEGEFAKPPKPITMPPSATGVLSYAELKQQEYENVLAALDYAARMVALEQVHIAV